MVLKAWERAPEACIDRIVGMEMTETRMMMATTTRISTSVKPRLWFIRWFAS